MPLKADMRDVSRSFVKREAFGEVIRAVGADVDSKATQLDLIGALGRIGVCWWMLQL